MKQREAGFHAKAEQATDQGGDRGSRGGVGLEREHQDQEERTGMAGEDIDPGGVADLVLLVVKGD